MRRALIPIVFSVSVCRASGPEPDRTPEIPTVEQVRRVIEYPGCGTGRVVGVLSANERTIRDWGVRAFPSYAAILSDAESDPFDVVGVCDLISGASGDRRHFVPLLVARLTDPNAQLLVEVTRLRGGGALDAEGLAFHRKIVHEATIRALGEVGDEAVTKFIRPFLAHEDGCVRSAAIEALSKIGGLGDLAELDMLLCNPPRVRDPNYIQKLRKCREELDRRLKANPAL